MADLTQVRAWAATVAAERAQIDAAIAAERAALPQVSETERLLRANLLGHLRHRQAVVKALGQFLADADAALLGGQTHPVQVMAAPASASGFLSVPRRPPRGESI